MGRKRESQPCADGSYSYGGLNRVMHEQARLGILTSLITHPSGLVFNDLKKLCDLTDGNLSRHLAALQTAKLIEVWKGTRSRYPQTLYRLTEDGRHKFLLYIDELERVVTAAQMVRTQRGEPAHSPHVFRPA